MSRCPLTVQRRSFPLRQHFSISRGTKTVAEVIEVTLSYQGHIGRGESVPYARYEESLDSVTAQIATLPQFDTPAEWVAALPQMLPAGAARNAVDCALWDLRAKQARTRVWHMLGLPEPRAVTSAYTLSLQNPQAMQDQASLHAHRPLLKVKLGTPDDLPRLQAVRAGAPKAKLIVDANEGWQPKDYTALIPKMVALGVSMIEQPFPAAHDDALRALPRPIPICADESCHDRTSLPTLQGKYDMVNIKLDKTGGMTEALATLEAARTAGFGVMVGCMVASSLGIAPAVLLAQKGDIIDLDGALLLAHDRENGLIYDQKTRLHPPVAKLWG